MNLLPHPDGHIRISKRDIVYKERISGSFITNRKSSLTGVEFQNAIRIQIMPHGLDIQKSKIECIDFNHCPFLAKNDTIIVIIYDLAVGTGVEPVHQGVKVPCLSAWLTDYKDGGLSLFASRKHYLAARWGGYFERAPPYTQPYYLLGLVGPLGLEPRTTRL